jgi:hypothetical protein
LAKGEKDLKKGWNAGRSAALLIRDASWKTPAGDQPTRILRCELHMITESGFSAPSLKEKFFALVNVIRFVESNFLLVDVM